jgi:hypothetical protein
MMNKFFVSNEVYEERMSICRACSHYSSLLGNCGICKCFMKIKSRIAPMQCPKGFWLKTTEIITPEDLPQDIIDEILLVWEDIKTGRAINKEAKAKMIELYNTIYMTKYSVGTNCGSCISTCFQGIKTLQEKYSK